ncbi:MAG: transposase [Sandaracinaceae bacterium]|nr:transposase [Sandaracinaceae bacterium]
MRTWRRCASWRSSRGARAVGRRWRQACTSACCCWGTSRGSSRSAGSAGDARTRASLKRFLGFEPHESTPDHSTLSRMRTRLPGVDVRGGLPLRDACAQRARFAARPGGWGDATYLRADASMKTIVREGQRRGLQGLPAQARQGSPGIENPTEEELRRFDRNREGKKTSNEEWASPTDSDAEIVRLKDGRTRLGYKAEHVVDMETGAPRRGRDGRHDERPSSIETSLKLAEQNLERTIARDDDDDDSDEPPSSKSSGSIREVVADKGYHKASTIRSLEEKRIRTYIPERLSTASVAGRSMVDARRQRPCTAIENA